MTESTNKNLISEFKQVERNTSLGDEESFLESPQVTTNGNNQYIGKAKSVNDLHRDTKGDTDGLMNHSKPLSAKFNRIKAPFIGGRGTDDGMENDKDTGSARKSVFGRLSANLSRSSRKSTSDVDDFEKTLDNIASHLHVDDGTDPTSVPHDQELVDVEDSPEKNSSKRSSIGKIKQLAEVKGKLGQIGRAAKSRLSQLSHPHGQSKMSVDTSTETSLSGSITATADFSSPVRVGQSDSQDSLTMSSNDSVKNKPPMASSSASSASHSSPNTPQAQNHQQNSFRDPSLPPVPPSDENDDGLKVWLTDERPMAMRRPSDYLEFERHSSTSSVDAGCDVADRNSNDMKFSSELVSKSSKAQSQSVPKKRFEKESTRNSRGIALSQEQFDEEAHHESGHHKHGSHHALSNAKHWLQVKVLHKRDIKHAENDPELSYQPPIEVEEDYCV
mmetsp:Transcript_10859/g.16534  ORF Transcript_10859/g.16534 Transcript_10859/m.16534 type:complete len:445 (+) Transcript_10859:27-1361(+)